MHKALVSLEKTTGLGPTRVAKLLGIAYVTYAQYRNESRPIQLYHLRHIEALLLLPQPALRRIIQEHVYGTSADRNH